MVEEMTLLVVTVILGQGARLFPETGPDLRSIWSNRESTRRALRSRSTGRPGGRNMQQAEVPERRYTMS